MFECIGVSDVMKWGLMELIGVLVREVVWYEVLEFVGGEKVASEE